MVLGLPDEIVFLLVYSSVATIAAVVFGILLYLVPPTGKLLLKARLKKLGVLFLGQKASIKAYLVKNLCPGWIETSDGKKFLSPIPPKTQSGIWNPMLDILLKRDYLDGIPTWFGHEAVVLTSNLEMLYNLEAYNKGYAEDDKISLSQNPREITVVVPVSPKVLAKVAENVSCSDIENLKAHVIDTVNKQHMRSEWGPIIKVVAVIGAVTIFCLIVLLIAKGALNL